MASPTRRITAPTLTVAAVVMSFLIVLALTTAAGDLLSLAERQDGSTGIDRSITSSVIAGRSSWLTALARSLSTIGSQKLLLPVVAVAALMLLVRRAGSLALLLVLCWAGGLELYSLAKYFVGRPRPPMQIWLSGASGSAFPSGHATQSLSTFGALALVCVALLPRARLAAPGLALVLAAGVGWSRVYLGVHWATDVVAGWLAAAAWVAILAWLAHTRCSSRD